MKLKAFHISGQYILSIPLDTVVWAPDERAAKAFVQDHLAIELDCDAPHTLIEIKFEQVWTRDAI